MTLPLTFDLAGIAPHTYSIMYRILVTCLYRPIGRTSTALNTHKMCFSRPKSSLVVRARAPVLLTRTTSSIGVWTDTLSKRTITSSSSTRHLMLSRPHLCFQTSQIRCYSVTEEAVTKAKVRGIQKDVSPLTTKRIVRRRKTKDSAAKDQVRDKNVLPIEVSDWLWTR